MGEREDGGLSPTDVELDFELDEHGRVWIIRDGDCDIIGRRDAVVVTMRRFLETALRDASSTGSAAPQDEREQG